MHKILYQPIFVISLVLGMLIMVELLALGSITWLNLNRIDKIKQDISQGHELEELVVDFLGSPARGNTNGNTPVTPATKQLHDKIGHFLTEGSTDEKTSAGLLAQIKTLFSEIEQGKPQDISQFLLVAQKLLNAQRANEEKLLMQVYQDSRLELNFAVLIPVAVLMPTFLLGIFFFKRQIMSPLHSLEQLLGRLTRGEMLPIETKRKDPIMQPLFNSYNRLIRRLIELEEDHQTHTQTLEHEVRNATHTLLEQSRTLARSERLAAVGELAASAAHELRNPLAGIQAALDNMREDCHDAEFSERLDLINNEVKRLTGRLNNLLAYSKQPPEIAILVNIPSLMHELLTLLRYQINENIHIECSMPEKLEFILPESEFRQALLNLLLNSVKELGDQGGGIRLTFTEQTNQLVIRVSDTGPGFPKNIIEQGVRPFVSYHEHGTGLGLAMVQRFVRSLAGQMTLTNDDQSHAVVTINLPRRI